MLVRVQIVRYGLPEDFFEVKGKKASETHSFSLPLSVSRQVVYRGSILQLKRTFQFQKINESGGFQ